MWAKEKERESRRRRNSCVGKEANGGWGTEIGVLVGEGEGCVTIATD